jgi:hypothetical protein
MKARDLLFIAIVIVVVGVLYFLSTTGKVKPLSPKPEHRTAQTREQCLACHTREKMKALEQAHKHPTKGSDEKVNCSVCHKAPQSSASAALDFRFRLRDQEARIASQVQPAKREPPTLLKEQLWRKRKRS